MRNLLTMCFAALASASAVAATVKTATQPWVEAEIADAVKDAGKVQSVNSQTGAVVLAASDVGAVAVNDFSAATNALAEAIAKAEPGDYAAVSNAAMTALQPAATNGLVTASVTNGLASQSSLTSLSSRVDDKRDKTDLAVYGADGKATMDTLAKMSELTTAGVLNSNGQSGIPLSTHLSFIDNGMETIYKAGGVNFWNGREVYDLLFPTNKENGKDYTIATTEDIPTAVSDLSDAGDYLKTAEVSLYVNAITISEMGAKYNGKVKTTLIAPLSGDKTSTVSTQSSFYAPEYVDFLLSERATTNALAAVKASIPAISATDETFASAVNAAARALVKSKLESLDRAKSSIGETIAALQSIYSETETK